MKKANIRKQDLIAIAFGVALSTMAFVFASAMHTPGKIAVAGEDGNGNHYKYVNTYELKAKYDGVYFIDSDGEAWKTDGEYTKGKTYTLEMSDNGTEGVLDDVIISVR